MKGQGVPPPSQSPPLEEDASRGRGYTADNYADAGGYGGGGGYGQQQQQPAARGRVPSAQAGGNNQQQPRRAAPPPSEYPEDDDRGFGGGGGGGGGGFSNDSFAGGGGGIPEGADEVVETFPCPKCERRFNAQALQKHIAKQICQQKPRKVFNMAAQRLEELAKEAREAGVKLNPVVPGAPPGGGAAAPAAAKGDNRPAVGKKGAKWRQDHEKFLAAIKAGRQTAAAIAAGVPLSSLPPPPPAREEDDTRTGCPHWFVYIGEQRALNTPWCFLVASVVDVLSFVVLFLCCFQRPQIRANRCRTSHPPLQEHESEAKGHHGEHCAPGFDRSRRSSGSGGGHQQLHRTQTVTARETEGASELKLPRTGGD
jgi:hypothetical protein